MSPGLNLSEEQAGAMAEFLDDLYEANQVTNLTRVPKNDAWLRHIEDSLLFQDLIPNGASVLDIGSGPGFPAWPLAMARPDLHVTALDSNGKMLGFLREHPLDNLTIVQCRAEEWGVRNEFDVVTGRALAPLPIQLELSAAACRLGGAVIPLRTELDDLKAPKARTLGLKLEDAVRRPLPETDMVRVFPIYRKIVATPARYPRRWTEIKASPLSLGA